VNFVSTQAHRLCHTRQVAAIGGAAILLLGLTSCSDTGSEVATLATAGASATPTSQQRQGAESLYSCLQQAGIPVELKPQENGDAWVGFAVDGKDSVLSTRPDGWTWAAGAAAEADNEAAFGDHLGDYWLEINGSDKSAIWQQCNESSKYADPDTAADPVEELKSKQAIVDATNAWVDCARAHGFPDLQDVAAATDNWEPYPRADLPLDTTVEDLTDLLKVCPNFDAERAARLMAPDAVPSEEDMYASDPSIGFKGQDDLWKNLPKGVETSPEIEHLMKLNEVLLAQREAFDSTTMPEGN